MSEDKKHEEDSVIVERLQELQVPSYYEVDFDKVDSFTDLISILKGLGIGVALYPDAYESSPLKKFLKKQ